MSDVPGTQGEIGIDPLDAYTGYADWHKDPGDARLLATNGYTRG